jgi:hypothetical protein
VSYASGAIRASPYHEAGQTGKENRQGVEREEIFTQFVKKQKNTFSKPYKYFFDSLTFTSLLCIFPL